MWNIKKENVDKQSVVWNIMSSGLNSVVSMFLLLVVTRVSGVVDAGYRYRKQIFVWHIQKFKNNYEYFNVRSNGGFCTF